ncbi:MAG: threonine--tRNA ligase [Euryarchaeota archaeon]|nr:threonine--tRNA ligase [Euryarchaeota archaeon]
MRLLLMHVDYFEYKTTKATKYAEDLDGLRSEARMEEALAVFIAAERVDAANADEVALEASKAIQDVATNVATKRVLLYPYAHLSSELASPEIALAILQQIESLLVGYEVLRAPFGWYKSFSLKCKGHPLAELSRSIKVEAQPEKKKVDRDFYVMEPDGKLTPANAYSSADSEFQDILRYELGQYVTRSAESELPHIRLMKEKELVEYEPLSDVGHLKWLPKGKLIRDLLIDYTYLLSVSYGAMTVETPVMYDLSSKAVSEHASKFGERQYRLKAGSRDMMLRFAACFGMFSMMHEMHLTSKDLPLKLYELSTYSFRYEQRGEVTGLKRQRAFTMPDMHTACKDMNEAKRFFLEQLRLGFKSGLDLAIKYEPIFRSTKTFYEENKTWVQQMVREFKRPFLLELLSERAHYWVCKCDLAALDTSRKPIECPTVQIDVESAERFDIKYYDETGEARPIILHTSPTGGIERVLGAILEAQALERVPSLPVWLAPTQVRIIPISDKYLNYAEEVLDEVQKAKIRIDIDDRDESINKKVAAAGKEWVPYVVVLGEKEQEEKSLAVTKRLTGTKQSMSVKELIDEVRQNTNQMPYRPLPLPQMLSKRPKFV